MRILYYSLAFALTALAASSDDKDKDKEKEKEKPRTPCTIRSPTTGAFFNLDPLRLHIPVDGEKVQKDARNVSWPARGWDYGANFTLNICGPVIEKLDDVVGVPEANWKNVSAFYEKGGHTYSIGQQNDEPFFRGRKLVLNYTNGSPCPSTPVDLSNGRSNFLSGSDEDAPVDPKASNAPAVRRKNTVISLLCASDASAPPLAISFVASPDSCTYFFEARTPHACAGIVVDKQEQQIGPAGVFGTIALIAVLVYLVGGCFYQRTVMHQRGWRQLPNFALWAGIGSFFKDLVIIAFSSCTRCLPSRGRGAGGRGYNQLGPESGGNGRGGRGERDSEDENRLIDQLDEEWED